MQHFDVLSRLTSLMHAKGWTRYRLAKSRPFDNNHKQPLAAQQRPHHIHPGRYLPCAWHHHGRILHPARRKGSGIHGGATGTARPLGHAHGRAARCLPAADAGVLRKRKSVNTVSRPAGFFLPRFLSTGAFVKDSISNPKV